MKEIPSKGLIKEVLYFSNVSNIGYQDNNIVFRDTTYYDCKPTIMVNISELKDKIKRWSMEQGYDIDEQPYGSQVVNLQTGDIEYGSLEKDRPKMKEEKSWYKPEHVFACGRYVLDKIKVNKKLEENR